MKELMITNLQQLAKELNKTPSREVYCKRYGITKRTVVKYFEKYNNLVIEAGLQPTRIKELTETKCTACDIQIQLPNYRVKEHNFCSISCSTSYNNKLRRIDRTCTCENCETTFTKTKDKVSNTCSQLCFMELGMKQRIMKDSVNRSGSNTYDNIRHNARLYSKYFYPAKCMICDYDKHYEVCHVKDLKDFTREETIYEVNNKTNLIHLCPNCHWEFDHNQLDLQKIREAQNFFINNL